MILKKFDRKHSVHSKRAGKATIMLRCNKASSISRVAAHAIGLKEGDAVCLLQDTENPKDWYLCKDHDGFPTRQKKFGALAFTASAVVNTLFDSINFPFKEFRFTIAKEGVKADKLIVHAIMTAEASKGE
jgi:hypothetical protein